MNEQKHKRVIREPKLEVLALDPFGPPSSLADGFCWTVLRILQLPQWKGTASAQMLSKSLLQVGPEREEQLRMFLACLRSWLTVIFPPQTTTLMILVLKKDALFENQGIFWGFPLSVLK